MPTIFFPKKISQPPKFLYSPKMGFEKKCPRCLLTKPVSEFPGEKKCYCRPCRNAYLVEYMLARPALRREKNRKKNDSRRDRRRVDEQLRRAYNKAREARYRAKIRKAGGRHSARDILALFDAQRGRCAACRCSIAGGYDVDHVVPLFLGGSNDRLNIQLLCQSCNNRKGKKHPVLFMQECGSLI